MDTGMQDSAEFTIPRPLLKVGVPCVGVLLFLFFLIRGFPFDQLADRITSDLEQSLGIELTIGAIGPVFSLAGPAIEANLVRAKLGSGEVFPIDRALLRPAWSLSWFSGNPAFYAEVDSSAGSAQGSFQLGDAASFVGVVLNVSLAEEPLASLLPTQSLSGVLEATVDIEFGEQGPVGNIELEITGGSVALPNVAAGLPFDRLTSKLSLGGDTFLTIESFEIEGSGATGSGSGKVDHAPEMGNASLDIVVDLAVPAEMSRVIRKAGLRADRDGNVQVRISGTVANPTMR
jgi:type II secretion system protein N